LKDSSQKYTVTVPITGSLTFLNVRANSAEEAIQISREWRGIKQELILWNEAQAIPIPPKVPREKRAKERKAPIDWSLYDHRIGVEPDSHIAKEIGCTSRAVRKRRLEVQGELSE
jgi:hypothetical protein